MAVAQVGRAPDIFSGGRGFEPRPPYAFYRVDMETAVDTKIQFDEFLKEMDFDKELTAICEQFEMDMNSAVTHQESMDAYRRRVKAIKELAEKCVCRYAARLVAQKVMQDIIQRASDSCDIIKVHKGGLLQCKS